MVKTRNPYGNIIRTERIKQGIGIDTLAARCMMSPLDIMDVESGNRWFSEAQLRLASATLSLDKESLLRGERAERTKADVIRGLLSELYQNLSELTRLQERILNKITEISTWQRFTVDQISKGKADIDAYEPVLYAIFDNDRGDYVRDENGGIVFFQSASEALERADLMERGVKVGKDAAIDKALDRIAESTREVSEKTPPSPAKEADTALHTEDDDLSEDNDLSEMIDDTLTGNDGMTANEDLEDEELDDIELRSPRL